MSSIGAIAGGLVLAFVIGAAVGYHRGYVSGEDHTNTAANLKVEKAQATARDAQAGRFAAEQERDALQDTLSAQRRQLEEAQAAALTAVAGRTRAEQQFDVLTARRKAEAKEAAHAQPDCSDLEHLPVCPAVAERLWGHTADAPAAASSRH